jgi:hypothetical protein
MLKHRSLSLKRFVKAVDPFLVEEYFTRSLSSDQPIGNLRGMGMTYDHVKNQLAGITDEHIKGKIGEELKRINDIGEQGMNILLRVTKSHDIKLDSNETPQQIAMKIFLNNHNAFEHAWALYCYYRSECKIYEYCLDCDDFKIDHSKLGIVNRIV